VGGLGRSSLVFFPSRGSSCDALSLSVGRGVALCRFSLYRHGEETCAFPEIPPFHHNVATVCYFRGTTTRAASLPFLPSSSGLLFFPFLFKFFLKFGLLFFMNERIHQKGRMRTKSPPPQRKRKSADAAPSLRSDGMPFKVKSDCCCVRIVGWEASDRGFNVQAQASSSGFVLI